MLTPEEQEYFARIAWAACGGIVGTEHRTPGGELYDGLLNGLIGVAEAAYQRGLDATMIQLSLVPDGARVVA